MDEVGRGDEACSMFNEKMPARSLAQCLACSKHLINIFDEDHGLLVTFIHCGMQKVAVDTETRIGWFSFCMSTCCDNTSTVHNAFIHPSILSSPLHPSLPPCLPSTHLSTHPSIYPHPFILSSDTHSSLSLGLDPSGPKMDQTGPFPASRSSQSDGEARHTNKWPQSNWLGLWIKICT